MNDVFPIVFSIEDFQRAINQRFQFDLVGAICAANKAKLMLGVDEERIIEVTYTNLLTTGKLPGYLTEIDGQAQEMFSRLIEQYAATEGITEQLKAEDQLAWVGRMNSIRERVEEIVLSELVYC